MNDNKPQSSKIETKLVEKQVLQKYSRRHQLIQYFAIGGVIFFMLMALVAVIYQDVLLELYRDLRPPVREPVPEHAVRHVPLIEDHINILKRKPAQPLAAPVALDPDTSSVAQDITHPKSRYHTAIHYNPTLLITAAQLMRPTNNKMLKENHISKEHWYTYKEIIVLYHVMWIADTTQYPMYVQQFNQTSRYKNINTHSGLNKEQYEDRLEQLLTPSFLPNLSSSFSGKGDFHEKLHAELYRTFHLKNSQDSHHQIQSFVKDLITTYDLDTVYLIWRMRSDLVRAALNISANRDLNEQPAWTEEFTLIEADRSIEILANEYHRVHPQLGPLFLGPKVDVDQIYGHQ